MLSKNEDTRKLNNGYNEASNSNNYLPKSL